MHKLNLKPNHKAINTYYQSLGQFGQLNIRRVRSSAFRRLIFSIKPNRLKAELRTR